MRTFSLFVTLAACEQSKESEPPHLWEILKQQPLDRAGHVRKPLSEKAKALRHPDDCKFPLDVLILQDATDSFADNFESMKNTQLDLMFKGILGAHPDSRFGVVSFKDKPVFPLGNRDDYCTKFDAPLSSNLTAVKEAYDEMVSYGGADAPENQFGSLYNVLSNKKANWSEEDLAARLVIISTDAGPHFAGDSRTDMLPPFAASMANDEDMSVCTARYYPAPHEVRRLIRSQRAYVASLVYDGDWANGWPSKSWIEFNKFIGQRRDFVAPQAPDSSDFWTRLTYIIKAIEEEECIDEVPTHKPRPPTPTNKPEEESTQPDHCECPCEHCDCCPEVIIRIQHRPNKLSLTVENDVPA